MKGKGIQEQEAGSSLEAIREERDHALSLVSQKSAFLANMTHEIRTPVHTINALTELLLQTSLDPEQKEYVRQLAFSGEVLGGLINDVLDLSKIESGKLVLESIPFSPAETLESAVDLIILQAHKKELEVVVSIDPAMPEWLLGDALRFRQVIVNLLSNAVKFTSQGELRLELHFHASEKPGRVNFSVHVVDTGIGISPEARERLFQPYEQADHSTTRQYGGTGLGLMISRSLVKMMGGDLRVDSEEGRGSDLHFTLSLPAAAEGSEPLMVSRVFDQALAWVVDDNAYTRSAIKTYLAFWGFSVEILHNGQEALSELSQRLSSGGRLPDILFMDHLMPHMGGWQLASELREAQGLKEIPRVLLSQTGRGVAEAKMKLLGWFAGYLNKPVKRSALGDLLCQLLPEEMQRRSLLNQREALVSGGESSLVLSGSMQRQAAHLRILIAEDHPVNQQLFETILRDWGFFVELASDGMEAVECASLGKIDCIFMDLHMPRLDGLEATRRIRSAGGSMPIIAVSASDKEEDRKLSRAAGMSDYLIKPFRQNDLVPLLKRWLFHEFSDAEEAEEAEEMEELDELEPVDDSGDQEFSAEELAVFNYPAAVTAFLGKDEVVRKLLPAFCSKVARQLESLKTAVAAGDYHTVSELAHAVKGSSLNLEARRLAAAAEALEEAVESGSLDPEPLAPLFRAFDEFKEVSRRF